MCLLAFCLSRRVKMKFLFGRVQSYEGTGIGVKVAGIEASTDFPLGMVALRSCFPAFWDRTEAESDRFLGEWNH